MMKTLMSVGLIILYLTVVSEAFSHAVVTNHTLKIESPKVNEAKNVELTFNSKIELGLSQVYLVSKGDKHTLLNIREGIKQGNVIVEIPSLPPGDYALRYKIFAADGHLTEDFIHFSITP